jgi:hypothetical protein
MWDAIRWRNPTTRKVETTYPDALGHWAKAHGYDGLIVKNVWDSGVYSENMELEDDPYSTIYAVFDPRNIKSAAYNSGLYDPNDSDIRHNPHKRGSIMRKRNPMSESEVAHVNEVVASGRLRAKKFTLDEVHQGVADADELMPKFKRMITKAVSLVSGAGNSKIKMDRKKAPSISRKMAAEEKIRSIHDLKDVLRGALLVEEGETQSETNKRIEDFYKLLTSDRFWKGSGFKLDSVKDLRYASQIYQGPIHLIFSGTPRSGNPMLIEIQLMPRCLWTIKSLSHIEYEKVRIAGGDEKEALKAAENLMARLFRTGQYCASGREMGRKAKHVEGKHRGESRHHNPEGGEFSSGRGGKKPSWRGTFRGESIWVEKKIETGKYRYIPLTPEQRRKRIAEGKEDRETMRVPIYETIQETLWLWNGRDWVKPEDYTRDETPLTPYELKQITRQKRTPAPKPEAKKTTALRPPKRDKRLERIARAFRADE